MLTHLEEYFYHMLFSGFAPTYSDKFNDSLVFETINQNWRISAPFGDVAGSVLE